MSKHTPGPWVVLTNRAGYPYQIHAPNGDDKKPGAVGSYITRWAAISLPSSEEGNANARLIAAAPDLLLALQMAKSLLEIEGYESAGASMRVIDAVIARATGEQS